MASRQTVTDKIQALSREKYRWTHRWRVVRPLPIRYRLCLGRSTGGPIDGEWLSECFSESVSQSVPDLSASQAILRGGGTLVSLPCN